MRMGKVVLLNNIVEKYDLVIDKKQTSVKYQKGL